MFALGRRRALRFSKRGDPWIEARVIASATVGATADHPPPIGAVPAKSNLRTA